MLAASPPPAPGRRSALRGATEATHLRMHGLPAFRAIEAGELPLERYRGLLSSLYRFHEALGAAAEAGGLSALSSAGRRLELLATDLEGLGASPPSPGPAAAAGSPMSALGALYVGEGSMLGGRVIARQLDYLFGSSRDGRRFFLGSDEDKFAWRRVVAALEATGGDAESLEEQIAGAEAAFALFERCMGQEPQ